MNLAVEFVITGPARRFYAALPDESLRGQVVTTNHRSALDPHPSGMMPPCPCKLADGSPVWVQPIHLKNPDLPSR